MNSLNQIIKNHELWLETGENQGECANLVSADLRRTNLISADFQNIKRGK